LSKNPAPTGLIIEWSPRKIVANDVLGRDIRTFTDPVGMPYGGRSAILAISRRSIFVRAARVPNAAPEDIRMVVQMKLAELFPLPPTDLAFDFALLSDLNEEGRLALIVAMPVTELRKAHEQMAAAGIKVTKVVPVALGSAMVAEALGYRDAAVVERSEDYASVDLIINGVLRYSRVAPPGTPVEVEISRTFNAAGLPCSAVIAAGGTQVGEADASTGTTALQALGGASLDRLKLNLQLPEAIAARELSARRQRQRIAAMMFIASLAVFYYAWSDRAETASVVGKEVAQLKTKQANAEKLAKSAQDKATSQQAIQQTLTAAFEPAQRLGDIAVQTTSLVPSGVWLTAMSVERGKDLTIRGTATSDDAVASFQRSLSNDVVTDTSSGQPVTRFRNVKLVFENHTQIEKTPVVEFSISAFPQGNLPIALTQKTGGTSSAH
jgi:Tfp pilus assembly protein PilN